VIWKNTDGRISVWRVDQNLNFQTAYEAGPSFGYDPGFAD
jgi:hypothetical protein